MKRWILSVALVVIGFAAGTALGLLDQPQPAPRELTSYREVVKRVLPAVVSIDTRAKAGSRPIENLPDEFRRSPADPNRLGFGSGFIADTAGVVVTNYHVVEGAETAVVHLLDGRKFTSKDIRVDRRTDVAVILLDIKDGKLPALEFGDSDAMEIGDRVLAVGAPFGLAGSVTHGIISAKGRNGLNMSMYEDYLQTDAAINPGNSGGPLVNLEGKVVGMCAAIKSKSGGFQGVGLAVASNLVKAVVPPLKTDGAVKRGYLGAHIREIDAEAAARLGVPKTGGVLVAEVYEKTPAAKAGILAGDIVTSVNGKAVKDGTVLQRIIAGAAIDKAVDIDVLRAGKNNRLTVVIEEQPADYGVQSAPRNPK